MLSVIDNLSPETGLKIMKTNKRCYKAPKVLQEAAVLLEFPFVASGEEEVDLSFTVTTVDQDVVEHNTDGGAYLDSWSW